MRGVSGDDPEGGAGSGVLRLRLVTAGLGRSGTPTGCIETSTLFGSFGMRPPARSRRNLQRLGLIRRCLYRKLDSAIMVMKSAEEGTDVMRPRCWMARWIGASL